jgi:SAM-dependent methyltransferase
MTESNVRRNSAVELFLLSLLSLYLELLVIRWMSVDVRAFSVFKTFPLVTCFIGMGVGYASQHREKLFKMAPVALLVFCLLMKYFDYLGISELAFPSTSVFYWHEMLSAGPRLWGTVAVFMIVLIVLLAGPFSVMACIGARIGALFDEQKPLVGYCINIGGAIVGSLLFTLASFLELSPALLLAPAAILLLAFTGGFKPTKQMAIATTSLLLAVGAAWYVRPMSDGSTTYWSPYQRLDLISMKSESPSGLTNVGLQLHSNRVPYQQALDTEKVLGTKGLPDQMYKIADEFQRRYDFPYIVKPGAGEVLVVGSGMGNDVAEALKHGAKHVDAVDIDPVIIRLGKELNPQKPYQSDRVTAYCDDARSFFNKTQKKYDLIVFSHIDSHVVTSSSVRIDNYVYTKQSIQKALTLLSPDGVAVISYFTYKNWFNDRLLATIQNGAGYVPFEYCDKRDNGVQTTFFILGKAVQAGNFKLPEALVTSRYTPEHHLDQARVLTDDWPYLYVTPGLVDVPYLLIVAELLLLAVFCGRKILFAKENRDWQMFFLGSGFLLLELQSIGRLSLLYGATWLTSAFVINGVLIMILGANLLVMRLPSDDLKVRKVLYGLLFASLIGSYCLPTEIAGTVSGGGAIVTLVTLLPMLLASSIFSISFRHVASPSRALAFNIFGAVLGAMLEYVSNYTGIGSLVLISTVLYAASFVAVLKKPQVQAAPAPGITTA